MKTQSKFNLLISLSTGAVIGSMGIFLRINETSILHNIVSILPFSISFGILVGLISKKINKMEKIIEDISQKK